MTAGVAKVKPNRHSTAQAGRLSARQMSERAPDPESCQSMADVRAGVDALDAELVRLLGRRFAYMRAAARIKPEREHVRDESRKAEVIANVMVLAQELGVPAAVVEDLWERLVEGSIDYEMEAWERKHRL